MYVSYKIRIYPNKSQEKTINRTCGACRWIYNKYINYNEEIYKETGKFVSGNDFSKIVTQLKKHDEKYKWLNEISQKAVRNSILNADEAYRRFFKRISKHPRFKSKKDPVQSYYFVPVLVKFKHNKVKLPILGNVRIKQNDYVPQDKHITRGTIVKEANKYYAVFCIDMKKEEIANTYYDTNYGGYGLDVGLKNYLTISDIHYNSYKFDSFLNDKKIVGYEEKIKYLKRIISNKMEMNYGRLLNEYMDNHHEEPSQEEKYRMKGKSYSNKCRHVQNKINKLNTKIKNYKNDRINKIVSILVKLKPSYITVETLAVSELLGNDAPKSLHDRIQKSKFGYFYEKLKFKCIVNDIELRMANKFFASSKKCSMCGTKKKDLKLTDRVFKCDNPLCNNVMDRDENASINLVELKKYTIYSV